MIGYQWSLIWLSKSGLFVCCVFVVSDLGKRFTTKLPRGGGRSGRTDALHHPRRGGHALGRDVYPRVPADFGWVKENTRQTNLGRQFKSSKITAYLGAE